MAGLLDLFGGMGAASSGGISGLFNDPTRMGLLNMGTQLLQASGPSPVRQSLGQIIGQGAQGFVQGAQSADTYQLSQMKRKQLERELQTAKRRDELLYGADPADGASSMGGAPQGGLIGSLPKDQRVIAAADPEGFIKAKQDALFGQNKETEAMANAKLLFPNDPQGQHDYVMRVTTQAKERPVSINMGGRDQLVPSADGNLVWADPYTHEVRAAVGPDGQPLRPKMKDVPATIKKDIAANRGNIDQIDRAVAEIDKYPAAVGGTLGNWASATGTQWGDKIASMRDPKGVAARAALANISSLVIHDRSGAAVTIGETPRLRPFIPAPTDDKDTIKTKLTQLKAQIDSLNNEIVGMYPEDQGYSPLNAPPSQPADPLGLR